MGGGSLTLFVSCRGKLARSGDLIIGSVIRYKHVAAAPAENSATNNITDNVTSLKNKTTRKKKEIAGRGEGLKQKKKGKKKIVDRNKLLKVKKSCNVTCAQTDVI